MFLRGLWNVSLNGDLTEISQRNLMPAGLLLLTNLSKKPPCHGANGRLVIQFTPILPTKLLVSTNTKLFPLSEMTLPGQPLRLMNLQKLLKNDTECRLGTRSNTIPLLDAHIYSVTQALWRVELPVFELKIDFTYSGLKLSVPVVKKMQKYHSILISLRKACQGNGRADLHIFDTNFNFFRFYEQNSWNGKSSIFGKVQ